MLRAGALMTGRLVRHRDGYGFVIPDQEVPGLAGDIFISPPAMADAMHGDRVQVRLGKLDERGRGEGRIHKVLERAHATVVGRFREGRSYNFVLPYDERLVDEILISRGEEIPAEAPDKHRVKGRAAETSAGRWPATGQRPALVGPMPVLPDLDGAIVNVEITRFPTATDKARGRVIEILGRPGDFGIDVEIIIRKHHLPHRFPPEALEAAAAVPQYLGGRDLAGRRDFRHLPIVTIDGETARDFDDAVFVERLPNGHYRLQVHIADVAHYVRPASELDREARLRGTSVYFPDRAVPMLPIELSSGICSLNPHADRLVMSCLMEMDHSGDVVEYELLEGVIRSAERMTYTAVNLILEGDAGLRGRYGRLVENFELMRELALILNRKREGRGSIDFDLPEPEIEFDEFGQMRAIVRSERNIAHRLIEEFMLAANETVAAHLEHRGVPTLYRVHEKPDPKKVLEFEEMAAGFGYSLGIGGLAVRRFRVPSGRGAGREGRGRGARGRQTVLELPAEIHVTSHHYQRLTEQIAGKPEERILSYLMLRSLKQARYSEENLGHFALAAPTYTHFTSPIRRYPDLMVHRVLKAVLHDPRKAPFQQEELKAIAAESSDAERRAQEAERELLEWKKVEFMAERVGEEFDALVVNVAKFGFFVELVDLFVEGLVPMASLTDDRYFFREPSREIVGERSRRRFRLGDRLRVLVDRVDPVAHKINFAVAEERAR